MSETTETKVKSASAARKSARRKFRHALLKTQMARLTAKLHLTPAAARFHGRVMVDRLIVDGTEVDTNVHGRGLVRK